MDTDMNFEEFSKYVCEWKYPLNKNRPELQGYDGEIQRGFALGWVFNRPSFQQMYHTEPYVLCGKLKWSNNRELLNNSISFFHKYYPKEFNFSTIQYNYNSQAAKHIDGNNVGESVIIAFGDYTGGRLIVYDKDDNPTYYDIKNKFCRFNGSELYHETEPFVGTRTSLVFFNLLKGTPQEHNQFTIIGPYPDYQQN